MPEEPSDPAKQSIGDNFRNLVPQKKKTPQGVWIIVVLAAFFVIVAFGITGYIVFRAVMEGRRAAHQQSAEVETTKKESATPASSVPSIQGHQRSVLNRPTLYLKMVRRFSNSIARTRPTSAMGPGCAISSCWHLIG
jgi:hypothetical protein